MTKIIVTSSYESKAIYISDVSFLTNDQSFTILENGTTELTPDLPCSISGSTSITFRLVGFKKSRVPDWIYIDSVTGKLILYAPVVSEDTQFYFYINSSMSNTSGTILKLIRLTVIKCIAPYCHKCIETDGSICEVWDAGYYLNFGLWDKQVPSTPISYPTSL